MVTASRNIDEKYKNYYAALTELIDFLDYGNTDAYFAQPTQSMQNSMGEAFAQYAKAVKTFIKISFSIMPVIIALPSGNWR